MKSILLKTGVFGSALFFAVYILLIVVGSFSHFFGARDGFYCNFYCWFSISLLSLAATYVISKLAYDIYENIKLRRNNI